MALVAINSRPDLEEIGRRLMTILLRNRNNQRPVYGGAPKFQSDPYWKDPILFYEYFHGDKGAGIGANHQTGWTGTIALVFQMFMGNSKTELNIRDASRLKMQYEPANVDELGSKSTSS